MKKSERSKKALTKWRKLVGEQARSGQKVAAFCRERGLCAPYFFAWKKKLSEAMAARLVEVNVGEPPKANDGISGLAVVLAGGRKIEVAAGFQEVELMRLIALLEKR